MTMVRGGKAEKTNWVMHQYHLGTEEDEKDGEYVISKIFYQQQQQVKQGDKGDQDFPENIDSMIGKVDPVTPKSVTPDPPRTERCHSDFDLGQDVTDTCAVAVAQVEPLSFSLPPPPPRLIFCKCFTSHLIVNERIPYLDVLLDS